MRYWRGAGLALLVLWVAGPAMAETREPTRGDLEEASERFSAGKAAYRAGQFVEAAEQFERADAIAPTPNALQAAMRSRQNAGQLDRAAILAALALESYPDALKLVTAARSVLTEAAPQLHRVSVRCDHACVLDVDRRLIHGPAARSRELYLRPGQRAVRASWSEQIPGQSRIVVATAGETSLLTFQRPRLGAGGSSNVGVISPAREEAIDSSAGWSPIVFGVGAGAAVVLGGMTLWSGIDTVNDPGRDRVLEECADTSCPLYQEGERKERRTNILLGATVGVGIVAGVIGTFLTDWSGKGPDAPDGGAAAPRAVALLPWVAWAQGATVGATGKF